MEHVLYDIFAYAFGYPCNASSHTCAVSHSMYSCKDNWPWHAVDVITTIMLTNVPAGTDVTRPEEGTVGAQKRKRKDGSSDPPNRVHVSREGDPSAGPPNRVHVSREGDPSADPPNPVHVSSEGDPSAYPPNRAHVSSEGDPSAYPPRAHVSMPPEPPAFTGFHHGHAIQNKDSLVGSLVTGRVDSQIDCGYFVSININEYTFQGKCDQTSLKELYWSQYQNCHLQEK